MRQSPMKRDARRTRGSTVLTLILLLCAGGLITYQYVGLDKLGVWWKNAQSYAGFSPTTAPDSSQSSVEIASNNPALTPSQQLFDKTANFGSRVDHYVRRLSSSTTASIERHTGYDIQKLWRGTGAETASVPSRRQHSDGFGANETAGSPASPAPSITEDFAITEDFGGRVTSYSRDITRNFTRTYDRTVGRLTKSFGFGLSDVPVEPAEDEGVMDLAREIDPVPETSGKMAATNSKTERSAKAPNERLKGRQNNQKNMIVASRPEDSGLPLNGGSVTDLVAETPVERRDDDEISRETSAPSEIAEMPQAPVSATTPAAAPTPAAATTPAAPTPAAPTPAANEQKAASLGTSLQTDEDLHPQKTVSDTFKGQQPRFDVVSFDASGEGVAAGVAEPKWRVDMYSEGERLATSDVDHQGRWVILFDELFKSGAHMLKLRATSPDGKIKVHSPQVVDLRFVEKSKAPMRKRLPYVAFIEPGKATEVLQKPTTAKLELKLAKQRSVVQTKRTAMVDISPTAEILDQRNLGLKAPPSATGEATKNLAQNPHEKKHVRVAPIAKTDAGEDTKPRQGNWFDWKRSGRSTAADAKKADGAPQRTGQVQSDTESGRASGSGWWNKTTATTPASPPTKQNNVRTAARDALDKTSDMARNAGERAGDAARSMSDKANSLFSSTRDKLSNIMAKAPDLPDLPTVNVNERASKIAREMREKTDTAMRKSADLAAAARQKTGEMLSASKSKARNAARTIRSEAGQALSSAKHKARKAAKRVAKRAKVKVARVMPRKSLPQKRPLRTVSLPVKRDKQAVRKSSRKSTAKSRTRSVRNAKLRNKRRANVKKVTRRPRKVARLDRPTRAKPKRKSRRQKFVVKNGDTLWTIAEAIYGDGKKYKLLSQANKLKQPFKIFPKQVLKIPGNPKNVQRRSKRTLRKKG